MHFTDFCGIFGQLPPDALQFYLQIFAQVQSLGCINSQDLLSKDGHPLYVDKIFPVRIPYARKLIRVLCKTMKITEATHDYLSVKLLKGSYQIELEGKASSGRMKRVLQAVDVTLVMEIVLTIYYEVRAIIQFGMCSNRSSSGQFRLPVVLLLRLGKLRMIWQSE